jgi:hypothetical protein
MVVLQGMNITAVDGITWKAKKLWDGNGKELLEQEKTLGEIAVTLSKIDSDFLRENYIKTISKLLGVNKKTLENRAKVMGDKIEEMGEDRLFKLPDGVDPNFVAEYGFYAEQNGPRKTGYWFDAGRDKRFFGVSNFIVTPLFHLYSTQKDMNKRMLEIDNGYAQKTIEIQSRQMISIDGFSGALMEEGHYMFHGARGHLLRLNDYWGDKFPVCFELTNLGWQKEGFFAYSDRVYNGDLLPYNEYGIIVHKEQHFYSPGANKKRSSKRGEAGKFDADHQLRWMEAPVTWERWCSKMAEVYPEHFITAIATVCMALLRDKVLEFSNNFPLLYCYGERQSGKSEFALSIMSCFVNDAKMFNLNSGTDAAFFTFISRYVNCFLGLNEFDDKDIRPEWFQAIKGFFDIEGRKRNIDKYRMEEQPVNCMAGLCGQYLSTRDDNSVVSRSLLCQFQAKPNRSQQEMLNFQELIDWQKKGLNGMLIEILKARFETLTGSKLKDLFDETLAELRSVARDRELRWEDRVGRNYALLITMGKWALQNWHMPYTLLQLQEYALRRMMDVILVMQTTDVLMEWFKTLSSLADQGQLLQGWHYKIKSASGLPGRKNGKDIILGEDAPRMVLMIRMNLVHQAYQKEYRKINNSVMNETSLVNYFKNREYFLGTRDGENFRLKEHGRNQQNQRVCF